MPSRHVPAGEVQVDEVVSIPSCQLFIWTMRLHMTAVQEATDTCWLTLIPLEPQAALSHTLLTLGTWDTRAISSWPPYSRSKSSPELITCRISELIPWPETQPLACFTQGWTHLEQVASQHSCLPRTLGPRGPLCGQAGLWAQPWQSPS
jgi:hypothetical protein